MAGLCKLCRLFLAASISPMLCSRAFIVSNTNPNSFHSLTTTAAATLHVTTSRALTSMSHAAAATHSERPAKQVLVPIANGSEEIESTVIIDTLVRAGAKVTVASVAPELQVTCSRGVKIVADVSIEDCADKEWDLVVCPGGMPGATNLRDSAALEQIIKSHYAANKLTAAICAAPAVVLGSYGILEDKAATCYPAPAFKEALPKRLDDRVVVDGNVVTSQGPGSSLEFAMKLVELLYGPEMADKLEKEMLVI